MTFTDQLEELEEELSEVEVEGPRWRLEELTEEIAELEDQRLEAWAASLSDEDQARWARTLRVLSTGGLSCDMGTRELIQRENGWNAARNNF